MAKLQFSLEGNALGEFALDKERITIGRKKSNNIHIDNLAVSGEHAAITTIGNDSFLEDLNSTNGTLVNDKPIKKHVLHHNDVIEFGKYQLLYINLTQAKMPASQAGFENTVVMRPTKLETLIEEPAPASQVPANQLPASQVPENQLPASEAPVKQNENQAAENAPSAPVKTTENKENAAKLKILSGNNAGRELVLNKAMTTLGKPGMQVAVVTKRPHGYFITHVEGESLPQVNSQKIGLQAHALNHRDVIEMSGIKMEFFLA